MRRAQFPAARSATVLLLIVNVAAFILQLFLQRFTEIRLFDYFALSLEGLKHGYLWQLLSFQFLHGGWLHLIINCFVIFMVGRELEDALGRNAFFALYFSSGVIGGLVQVVAGLLLGGMHAAPVVGASAGGFGLIAAFGTLYAERMLTLFIFLVLPVTMRAKFLIVFFGVGAILGLLFSKDNVAHGAHLGGLLAGIGFIRYAVHWQWPRFAERHRRPLRRLVKVHSAVPWGQSPRDVTENLPPEEFLSKEVDPILDKISAHGINSLTERERRILEAARQKMGKR